jgi:ATP-dependent helicase HrpA
MRRNTRLVQKIKDMENRIRRRDILVDDEGRVKFYKQRLSGVYDKKRLIRLIRKKGGDEFLHMKPDDLMNYQPGDDLMERYPEHVDLGGRNFMCNYRFKPGQPEDGLTVSIPAVEAPMVPIGETDWMVPGLLSDKIEALLKGLPKRYRKKLVPIARTVEIVLKEMPRDSGALMSSLGKFIYHRFGIDIPAAAWSPANLPAHLTMRIAVTNPRGEVIQSSRDPRILRQISQNDPLPDGWEAARHQWEKTGISQWDFADLPISVDLELKGGGRWAGFPALAVVDDGAGSRIDLRLFRNRETAVVSHAQGVAALYQIHFSKDLKFLKKSLTLPPSWSPAARYFGGIRKLEKLMYNTVVARLFRRDIRSREAFLAEAVSLAARIIPPGRELNEKVLPVVDAYHAARTTIHQLETGVPHNRLLAEFCRRRKEELVRLVPDRFVEIYDLNRLGHLPRYIKAVEIRARRASVNFEKEKLKAAELKRFSSGLQRLISGLSPLATQEKRHALEEFYWLVEEYKVSLFAQELKTAVTVSEKRLQEVMEEIERMV